MDFKECLLQAKKLKKADNITFDENLKLYRPQSDSLDNYYFDDFETTTDTNSPPEVFSFGCLSIDNIYSHGYSISEYFERIYTNAIDNPKTVRGFFNGGKFDFYFIFPFLKGVKNGELSTPNKEINNLIKASELSHTIILGDGAILCATLSFKYKNKTHSIQFIDLRKRFSAIASIKSLGDTFTPDLPKGDLPYQLFKNYRQSIDLLRDRPDLKQALDKYQKRDCEILRIAYIEQNKYYPKGKLTASGAAYTIFKTNYIMRQGKLYANKKFAKELAENILPDGLLEKLYYYLGNQAFKYNFPKLGKYADDIVRKSYRGGYVNFNKQLTHKINSKFDIDAVVVKGVNTFDCNSMYPAVMRDFVNPIGAANPIENLDEAFNYKGVAFVGVKLPASELKFGAIPCLPVENKLFGSNYLYECSDDYTFYGTISELKKIIGYYEINPKEITFIEGVGFHAVKGLFDEYIDCFRQIKENSSETPEHKANPVLRDFAKLMMNGLYGKFGTKEKFLQTLVFRKNILAVANVYQKKISENNYKYYVDGEPLTSEFIESESSTMPLECEQAKSPVHENFYTPIAANITTNARISLYRMIDSVGWDKTIYCDTDSVKALTVSNKMKLLLHPSLMGYWKSEGVVDMKVLAPKKYISREFVNGKIKIKITCNGNNIEMLRDFITKGQIGNVDKRGNFVCDKISISDKIISNFTYETPYPTKQKTKQKTGAIIFETEKEIKKIKI